MSKKQQMPMWEEKQKTVEKTALSQQSSQLHHTCDLRKATVCLVELILLNIAKRRFKDYYIIQIWFG